MAEVHKLADVAVPISVILPVLNDEPQLVSRFGAGSFRPSRQRAHVRNHHRSRRSPACSRIRRNRTSPRCGLSLKNTAPAGVTPS